MTGVDAAELLFAVIQPHPDLVAAVRPTPRQVAEAGAVLGLLSDPDDRWFRAAVGAPESSR